MLVEVENPRPQPAGAADPCVRHFGAAGSSHRLTFWRTRDRSQFAPGPVPAALAREFAACLASVTEVPVTDVPRPDDGLAQALGA